MGAPSILTFKSSAITRVGGDDPRDLQHSFRRGRYSLLIAPTQINQISIPASQLAVQHSSAAVAVDDYEEEEEGREE